MRACGCIGAIRPVSPPLPVLSSRGLDTAKMPHSDLNEESGTGEFFLAQYKVTDVTDVDVKDISLSPVSKIKTHGCSLRAKSYCSTSKTAFFPKINACFCRGFDL